MFNIKCIGVNSLAVKLWSMIGEEPAFHEGSIYEAKPIGSYEEFRDQVTSVDTEMLTEEFYQTFIGDYLVFGDDGKVYPVPLLGSLFQFEKWEG